MHPVRVGPFYLRGQDLVDLEWDTRMKGPWQKGLFAVIGISPRCLPFAKTEHKKTKNITTPSQEELLELLLWSIE